MKPEEHNSGHMLQLSPSVATPFTHDSPGAHDSTLDELRSEVEDSAVDHVQMYPLKHEYDAEDEWFNRQFFDELSDAVEPNYDVPPFAHEIGNTAIKSAKSESDAERDAINRWIDENIKFKYVKDSQECIWRIPDGSQTYLQAHRREIMETIPERMRHRAQPEDILEVLKLVAPGETFGNEFALRMIKQDPSLLMNGRELFPDFKFDMDYVRAMMSANRSSILMSNWRLIDENCLQEAVDYMLKWGAQSAVYGVIDEIGEKVNISREALIVMAEREPHTLLEIVQRGLFPEIKKDIKFIQLLCHVVSVTELLDTGVLDELTISELGQLLTSSLYRARMFRRLRDLGRMNTLDEVAEVIESFGMQSILSEIPSLSREFQSYVFQTLSAGSNTDWIEHLGRFSRLSDDDYTFILDSMQLIGEKLQPIDQIRDLFRHASEHLQAEFELSYVAVLKWLFLERKRQEDMNERRKFQSEAERTYYQAGNVSVEPHDYHEHLDPDDIIKALELDGCVRMAGDIQEIANDPSRGNTMTCIAGSRDELSTYELGENAATNPNRRMVTEHQALQDFLKFIRTSQNDYRGYRDSLGTELTYIGEKEYSEAVEGIALYWKWFLEQDPESQLYIGAAVSHEGGTTKSDVYMLDRILEHFSDDEMAKYVGRILTGKDKVTQQDPEKVKVALIDDWTISGSQLRGAYGVFINDYPHLAKSMEVQLIAASRERVALGIESVSSLDITKDVQEKHNIPTKVRAYYVAHRAESAGLNPRYARITGSHSSVDYGFTSDIVRVKGQNGTMPLIASIVRPYRQSGYRKTNIERLKRINEVLNAA